MKRLVGVVIGALIGLNLLAPKAEAVLVAGSLNTVEYVNFENLFTPMETNDGLVYVAKPIGALPAAGDILAGIINANDLTVNGVTTSFDTATLQLSGIFWQEISSLTVEGPDIDGAGPDTGTFHLTLSLPSLASGTTLFCNASQTDCFQTGLSSTDMIAFYLQTGGGTTAFESNGTMADDVTKATDGGLYFTMGPGVSAVDVGPGVTYSHVNFNFVSPLFPVQTFGGLNVLTNNTGLGFAGIPGSALLFDPDGLVGTNHVLFKSAIVPNPNRLAPPIGVDSPWLFRSDDPAFLLPTTIPEVSSLWMLGMGLGGFGIFGRRKFLG